MPLELNPWACATMLVVVVVTFFLGYHGSREANTTGDFLVARRRVSARRNGAAIAAEFLSASSFLGIAGLVLKQGPDQLWYAIGFAAGQFALLLFVAAPLRRSGAYTLPDFVMARLGSDVLRVFAGLFVLLLGYMYLIPQLQTAGLVVSTIIPAAPMWIGVIAVVIVVVVNVLSGGMRTITLVQAFQYWLMLFAMAIPVFILVVVFLVGGSPKGQPVLDASGVPTFSADTTVTVDEPIKVHVTKPVRLEVAGTVNDQPANGQAVWLQGYKRIGAHTTLHFAAGEPVPVAQGVTASNASWLRPQSSGGGGLVDTYSLILAAFLGVLGLPHVLARFYTNPHGHSARRTTLHVLLLIGVFFLFPTLLGVLSRLYQPQLLLSGHTDAAAVLLPTAMMGNVAGKIVAAVIAAGAFAAFTATSAGLLVSLASVLSTDLSRGRIKDFRLATVLVMIVPILLAIYLPPLDVSVSIGTALAMAASTFCPVLLLGIWWRGLTWIGAAVGMATGGILISAAVTIIIISGYTGDWAPTIVKQPALITAPIAFAMTYLVSKATSRKRPADINLIMLRLHAPDALGFIKDRETHRLQDEQPSGRHRRLPARAVDARTWSIRI